LVGEAVDPIVLQHARHATFSRELTLMFHLFLRIAQLDTSQKQRRAVWQTGSKEGAVKNGMDLKKFRRCCLLPRHG